LKYFFDNDLSCQ